MANSINYNFRTGRTYADSDGFEGKALEIYINLQSQAQMKILEEKLRDVLQDKLAQYEEFDEHTRLYAKKETTVVKCYVKPEEKKPIEGEYSTLFIYELACEYNLTSDNMEILKSGGHIERRSSEVLKEKMDLVSPSEGKSK